MRSFARTWFVAAMLLTLCGHVSAASTLGIDIRSSCAKYGMQDELTLSVALQNQGNDPIVLYGKLGWGELGGVTLKVSRVGGELIHQEDLDHDMIVPSTLQSRDYYTKIFANQFVGITRTEQAKKLFPGPGQYKVWAEYLSPVPAASALIKDDFWSMEKGRISSRPILLTVTRDSGCVRQP